MLTFAAEAILSTKHKNYITRATYQQTNKKKSEHCKCPDVTDT